MKDFNRALNYSFFLLKYRARSKFEIRSRLKNKGYSPGVIEQTIDYLEENNYINDESFAAAFVAYSQDKGWGPRRIDFNLKKLGVADELREKALIAAGSNYQEKIREIIRQKLDQYKGSGVSKEKIWQRISRSLAAKGFNYADIYQEMKDSGVSRFEDK